jgi:RNA polymerase sigma-70 factor (ECF subfamily)
MNDFEQFYKANYNRVYYYLINLSNNANLAEELTQETFYKAMQFIIAKGTKDHSTAWLLKIAHNLFVDYIRKNKISLVDIEAITQESRDVGLTIEEKLDLYNLLNELPIRFKTIIILKDYFGFSYQEISDILNCSLSTVKMTLHRARDKFKEVFTNE